ncbi:hypothetical protein HU200_027323 [Digitaria exilis]|uniref:F-box domain-containing protein n=1 Tax=Digitaria exilis TaxID=1010633 RepID=A0A835ETB7_9POAL|nr:hypothetical protein HU200_027323 [Digitaria exilis]
MDTEPDRSPSIAMDMETPAASGDGDRGHEVVVDRLSALPDLVLRNVLSCLTSLQAARTSVLSRRWRHLWRSVPCIDIDQREFFQFQASRPPIVAGLNATWIRWFVDEIRKKKGLLPPAVDRWDRFEDFADRMSLLRHDASSPLEAFRLRVACDDFHAAHKWIRRGVSHRPAALHVRCDNDAAAAAGGGGGGNDDTGRGWPCFPTAHAAGAFTSRLRTLRLSGLTLTSALATALATDFPVLEDMELHDCRYEFSRLVSASLTNLSIEYHHGRRAYSNIADELVLATPRVVTLRVLGNYAHAPPVALEVETPRVAEATLMHRAGDLGVLRSLRDATSLKLFCFSTAALLDDGEPGGFPAFRNLRSLLLDRCDVGADCHVLQRFLRNAPCLETLTLRSCLRSRVFSGGAPMSRSRKRKERARRKKHDSTGYPCREPEAD